MATSHAQAPEGLSGAGTVWRVATPRLDAKLLEALAEVANHLGDERLHGRDVHDLERARVDAAISALVQPDLQPAQNPEFRTRSLRTTW